MSRTGRINLQYKTFTESNICKTFFTILIRNITVSYGVGGINASLNTKGQNDSIEEHFHNIISVGKNSNHITATKKFCENAPKIIE